MAVSEKRALASKAVPKEELARLLRAFAKDFASVEPLLEMPDRLYKVQPSANMEFSDKEGVSSSFIFSLMKMGGKIPDASETTFTLSMLDTSFQTYFFLCDPQKRILVIEPLLLQGKGSWESIGESLKSVNERKRQADERKEKYNFVASYDGNIFLF